MNGPPTNARPRNGPRRARTSGRALTSASPRREPPSGGLAPLAIAAGVLGRLFSGTGMSARSRPGVTGRGVALLGLLGSIAGVVFGVLAMNGVVSWLNSDVDQVAQFRDWLNSHLTWLRRW